MPRLSVIDPKQRHLPRGDLYQFMHSYNTTIANSKLCCCLVIIALRSC